MSNNSIYNTDTFSFIVGVSFTLNYIIGTGFLTLPWAFNKTGYVIGSATLIFLTIFSTFSVIYILEALARAKVLNENNITSNDDNNDDKIIDNETSRHPLNNTTDTYQSEFNYFEIESSLSNNDLLLVGKIKYETSEISELFLGKIGRIIYTFAISIFLFSALWAYSTVFATACSKYFDLGSYSYNLFLILYSIIVIPLTIVELNEQIIIQLILSLCRILMISLMIITIIHAKNESIDVFESFSVESKDIPNSTTLDQLKNLYYLLPIAVYANIFHHSVPSLSQLVNNKKMLSYMFIFALSIAAIGYATLGGIIADYFGNGISASCNINWISYKGILNSDGTMKWYNKGIVGFIVLFPAFDVASAFPLNAITLSNNLMSSYYGSEMHKAEKNFNKKLVFRLITAILPIIIASLDSNLGVITHYAGLAGFLIAYTYPPLLAYYSKKILIEKELNPQTYYSTKYLGLSSQIFVFSLGLILLVFVGLWTN